MMGWHWGGTGVALGWHWVGTARPTPEMLKESLVKLGRIILRRGSNSGKGQLLEDITWLGWSWELRGTILLVSRGGGLGFSDVSSPLVILIHLHQSVPHLDCNFTHLELYQVIAYSLILQHLCPALNVHVLILQPHLLLLHPPHLMVSTLLSSIFS